MALAFLLMGLQAPALAVLILTAATALALRWVCVHYRGDLSAAEVKVVSPDRDQLDRMLAGDMRAALAVGATAGVIAWALGDDRPELGIAPISAVILGVTAVAIVLSSLIDWYVILPRISGLLGVRPCRRPNAKFPRHPKTFRELTRWWYIHRIAAALALRYGISFAISLTVARHTSIPDGGGIVAGAAAGTFAGYFSASGKAVMEGGHATLIVGQTIIRRDVRRDPRTVTLFGNQIRLPIFTVPTPGDFRQREYVYDVAVEGVQLAWAARREAEDLPHGEDGELEYEGKPNKLLVKNIDASTPESADRFSGCGGRCSGINWYCIENPLCFAPK